MSRHLILSLLILLAAVLTLHADHGTLLTPADGLSGSTTNSLVQDARGFVWIGTEYGLNRYDGYRFTTFLSVSGDTTSLPSNEVTTLFRDHGGELWVGCSKGLARYSSADNRFVRYTFSGGLHPRVESIVEAADGHLLLGTAGYGTFMLAPGQRRVVRMKQWSRNHNDEFASRLFIDSRGALWRSSHNAEVSRLTWKGSHLKGVRDYVTGAAGPVVSFVQQPGGVLLVCMYGLLRYDYATGAVGEAGYDLSLLDHEVSIRHGMTDRHGNLYLGTSGRGLMVVRRGTRRLEPVADGATTFSLSTSNVNDIYEDRDHNLWVSCYHKGVFLLARNSRPFRSVTFTDAGIRLGSSIASIAADGQGGAWGVVQKAGVYHFLADGTIHGPVAAPESPNAILRDRRGSYWVGTENGLWSYDPTTGAAQRRLTLGGWGVNALADIGGGRIAVSNFGKGFLVFDTATGQTQAYAMGVDRGRGRLTNDWVRTFLADRRGRLWIGTADGLSCMNPSTGDFRVMGSGRPLADDQVFALCECRDGLMLIGTSRGLWAYDTRRRRLFRLPDNATLGDVDVYGIVEDRGGDLWLSTANGIWQYDHRRRHFVGHIHGNGLASPEYIEGAALHDASDRIAFATGDGITTFLPDAVRRCAIRLGQVQLSRLAVNDRDLGFPTSTVELSHDENNITIDLSLMNYPEAADIVYQYRLGGEGRWLSLGHGVNRLSLGEVKPGTYRVEARAIFNGRLSPGNTVVTLRVHEPWYATTWAWLAYILAALGAMAAGFVYVERRRAVEMEDQKMQFLINATHDIRSPLTLILGPLDKLRQTLQGTPAQAYVDTIDHNARRLLLLVNQILDERRLDKNQLTLQCAATDLVGLIRGVCSMFQYNATQHHITLAFDHDDDRLEAWVDAHNFEKVLVNLLSNAFKYTPDGGDIRFRLFRADGQVVIRLTDTGPGFKPQDLAHVFDRFYQGHARANHHATGTGIGLNLCNAIVTMHGGTITAANRTDHRQGAMMEVRLPDRSDDRAAQKEAAPPQHTARSQGNRNIRVMLVDDDSELTQYIARELAQWYRFEQFTNGRDAMQALLQRPADIVVSDIVMPVMDGIALLKEIKGNTLTSDIPVVLLTSKGEADDRLHGLSLGANAYLEKPFSMDELHTVIDNLVDNVRLLRGKYSGSRDQADRLEVPKTVGNDEQLMARIMKAVNAHLADPDFNVEALTREVGISRAQLHRKLKEITGVSTADFIRNLRLQRAAELLAEGKVGVTQVAYDVGFGSQSHFSTVFRRHFGVSPRDYAAKRQDETKTNVREI